MLSPSSASSDDPPPSHSWKNLVLAIWEFIGPSRRQFFAWSAVLVISQIFVLIPPFIIGHIVDFFMRFHPGDSLQPFYNDVLLLGGSSAIAAYIRLMSKDRLGKIDIDIVYRAKVEGFDRLMRFPLSWHQKENTGNKMQRLQAGTANLRQLLRIAHDDLPALAISFFGVLGVFLFLDWIFAAFLAMYLAVFFAIEFYFYRQLEKTNHQFNQATEISMGTYLESAHNVLTIKTMGAATALKSNLDKVEITAKDRAYNSHHLMTRKWQIFQIANAVSLALFLIIVGRSVLAGVMTAGAIFVYFSYYQRLTDSATSGLNTLLSLVEYKTAIERMMPIFREAPVVKTGLPMPDGWDTIEITNAGFEHGTGQQKFAIDGLNLTLRRGEKVGIVGHSGSGKSTLAKLLLGIYQLQEGSIRIGGIPLAEIDTNDLTRHITIVQQEPELFNMPLRDNITMMKAVNEDVLAKAVRIAQLQSVIDKLADGLDTVIGERGGKLSGGEKQRIGIARALCADTEIIVLDEATSALDGKTEILVQQALEKELHGKTLIIIAHRLMTLDQVDRIVVFSKGRIIEQDAFSKLLARPDSEFSQLYRLQQPQVASIGTAEAASGTSASPTGH